MDEELLTEKQLCEWLQIVPSTAYRWRKSEGLPYIGSRKRIRYRRSDVVKWLEKRNEK